MAGSFLNKIDKTVDRVGYWAGAWRLISENWSSIAWAVTAFGAVSVAAVWNAWRYVQMIAANVSFWFYPFFATVFAFAIIGAGTSALLLKRFFSGETALGELRLLAGAMEENQKLKIAENIDSLCIKIAAIYGSWESEYTSAWSRDGLASSEALRRGEVPFVTVEADSVNRRHIQTFSERHLSDARSAIAMAKKYVSIDASKEWNASHGVRRSGDLHDLLVFLSDISATLKTGRMD
jgi:hypothetical protein